MTIKVFGIGPSSCTLRVVAALNEKELDWELVPVNLKKGAQKTPEHLALQPFGKIPVMVDGDITLFESRAIIRYVATEYQEQGVPLYGTSREERALVDQWLEVEGQNFNPPIESVVHEIIIKPMIGQTTDEKIVEKSVEKLGPILDVYENQLSKSKYLAGDFFSLADLSHLSYATLLIQVLGMSELFYSRPHVKAWWEDISSRPTWQKTLALAKNWGRPVSGVEH